MMQASHKLRTKKSQETETASKPFSLFQGDTETGKKINEMLNSGTYAVISTIVLLYTLFSDDVRQTSFPASADLTFTYLTLICMIYYGIEIVVYSFVQKDYFLGYYFWLDLISTLTMAFDLVWITQYLTGGGKNAANISQISRASRAARLGTRTVKLIRLIRMIKIIKQMKALSGDIAKNQKNRKPKKSQRISKMQSKVTSIRNVEIANSLRNMERHSTARWSKIKDNGCLGPAPIPIHINSKSKIISLTNFVYENNPDRVIDDDSVSDKSGKSVSINKGLSNKKVEINAQEVEPTNQNMVIPANEGIMVEERVSQEEGKLEKMIKSKTTRKEIVKKDREDNRLSSQYDIQIPPESKVGARVQEDVQKNVISMIILILLSIPLLDGSTWFTNVTKYDKAQVSLIYFAQNYPSQYQTNANLFIETATTTFLNPLLYFSINTGNITDTFPDNYPAYIGTVNEILAETRSDDINLVMSDGCTFAYDITQYNIYVSYFNIGRTIFVCLLLIITTIFFSSDLEFTAIAPLEEMMETVRKIAINPLNAIRQIQEKNMCMEKIEEEEGKDELTEPKILQNTIVKISSLLAVGFGEAGTEIICKVIEDPRIIDVMIPGQKIMAIFGFCDIRNFTDATEVLQADVMVFVNEIAAICHKQTYEHLGSPNKNIGDAFLLVWKFSQDDYQTTETEHEAILELNQTLRVSQMADLSVLSLVNMVGSIARSETLQKYKNNKGLQARIANYLGVKMGFGLHVGWAIEGPIGSEYKIDASYLGPDVHMASRLEAATKGYGTGMLITEALYNLMTQNKRHLRWIDRVISEEGAQPMNLYTVDINHMHLFQELGTDNERAKVGKEKRLAKVEQNVARKALIESIQNNSAATTDLWNDQQIKIMQETYSNQFYKEWKSGFEMYLEGNWEKALPQLKLASSLGPNGFDGPSASLITFIQSHDGRAPIDWRGYRNFD